MTGTQVPRVTPIRQYVLKVHSRCDLACDHCYVYEHADQSWRHRPAAMAAATVQAAARRIADHARAHALDWVGVVLHGGEPLLLGVDRLREVLSQLRGTIGEHAEVAFQLQTNGVRLTAAMCDLFAEYGVRVGVSLDGDAAANDRHRRFANGMSSHAKVLDALRLLRRPEYAGVYGGLLCTVDIANDPIAVYEALCRESPPRVDFLLPHGTWETPPAGLPAQATPYADWLLAVYDRWSDDGRPMPIRTFDSLRSLIAGGSSRTEALGLDTVDLAVIEADGTWEQVDSLKTAYDGAPATGLDIFRHSVDEVAGHPAIAARQGGLAGLCATCQACPVVTRCGGGLVTHRYRAGSGFLNPSVYCQDLKKLITTVELSMAGEAGTTAEAAELIKPLATGCADAAALSRLADHQLGLTKALLAEAVSRHADLLGAGAAWEALLWLDDVAPNAVATVLRHPFVRSWAVRCLTEPGQAEIGYLAGLAAACAILSDVDLSLGVAPVRGAIVLPTIGAAQSDTPAEVRVSSGTASIHFGHSSPGIDLGPNALADARWRGSRRALVGGWPVLVEDTDPYRDCFPRPVAQRLTEQAADRWLGEIGQAFAEIERLLPAQAGAIGTLVHSLVPLEPPAGPAQHSGTARHAFGAVAMTMEAADSLAVLLTHEVQHVKLGALLDLHDLVGAPGGARITVAWRPDPRPPEGVLQGVYAHLAVADIWRRRAETGSHGDADRHFQRYRHWTGQGIASLRESGLLTRSGDEFVDHLASALREWDR